MKDKKVFFIPKNEEVFDCIKHPQPAKRYIPDWFKKMPQSLLDVDGNKLDGTAKICPPFTDSFLMGYIQELPCDILINYNGYDEKNKMDLIEYQWSGDFRPLSTRLEESRSSRVLPDFNGYYKTEFHWNTFWEPETPTGYSTLYMHPLNRYDLPFLTLNGVIDTDKWSIGGALPFLIKHGFQGIIPAGTPIYQTIFIKRESWSSDAKEYDKRKQSKMGYSIKKFFTGGYKKEYWSRKEYN